MYAGSRFSDERFYEGTEKRNEFEQVFADLIDKIESGVIFIEDSLENPVENNSYVEDHVKDVYFNTASEDVVMA